MDFNWLMIFVAALLGLIIGMLVMNLFRKEDTQDKEKLTELEEKFGNYKQEVSDHFIETAAMVNQLTSSYKNVYDHLEKGAYKLVGEEEMHKRLEDVESQPVLLEYIGKQNQASDSNIQESIKEEVIEEPELKETEDIIEQLNEVEAELEDLEKSSS